MVISNLNTMLEKALEAEGINPIDGYDVRFYSGNKIVDFTFNFKVDKVIVKTIIYFYSNKISENKSEYKIPCNNKGWEELIENSLEKVIRDIPEHLKHLLKE